MNSIDKLIALADVRGNLDLRCQLQGDWALDHDQEAGGIAPYHIVLAGECLAELADGQRIRLKAGDILVLPSGTGHLLVSKGVRVAPSQPERIEGGLLTLKRMGTTGEELDVLCGRFLYNRDSMLFGALPGHVLISSTELQAGDHLPALVALLRGEADANKTGGQFIINALTSALFALILRAHLHNQPQASGTLALMNDKRLSKVWQSILDDPAHDWTIEGLASIALMSRATFMRSFTKLAGISPWVMLTRVRMELAYSLLTRSHSGLSDIAAQVGYQSQAAFSKVFKETYGEAPGRFRRSADSATSD
ncbi:AraC family transcriptional regulator [Pseudomonas sp. NA-150]|uniref:AraC family transcriptional regulator n=1 Tax=Pseudomonas sp. NA-150 TaxID=3367525 RepID=UPI0037C74A14